MLIIFLFGLVGMILLRTLRKDYIPLGEEDESEVCTFRIYKQALGMLKENKSKSPSSIYLKQGITDESGWKVLHREVFRPPNKLAIFSAVLGSNCFTLLSLFYFSVTLALATINRISPFTSFSFSSFFINLFALPSPFPNRRGAMLTAFIMWHTFFTSIIAGYTSGSFYAKNKGFPIPSLCSPHAPSSFTQLTLLSFRNICRRKIDQSFSFHNVFIPASILVLNSSDQHHRPFLWCPFLCPYLLLCLFFFLFFNYPSTTN